MQEAVAPVIIAFKTTATRNEYSTPTGPGALKSEAFRALADPIEGFASCSEADDAHAALSGREPEVPWMRLKLRFQRLQWSSEVRALLAEPGVWRSRRLSHQRPTGSHEGEHQAARGSPFRSQRYGVAGLWKDLLGVLVQPYRGREVLQLL